MTELDKSFYINTEKDGLLGDTTKSYVENLVAKLKDQKKIVLHFHGGLVSKKNALESAAYLKPAYMDAGAYPVFFVWESDLLATLAHNLHEIDKETIFKTLLKLLVKFTVGKLIDVEGGKATGELQLPNNIEVASELKKIETGAEPYSSLTASPNLQAINQAERNYFETTLKDDITFQEAVQNILDSATPENEKKETSSKGVLSLHRHSEKTLMSQNVITELKEDMKTNDGKGILSTAMLVKRGGEILTRVIKRIIEKRDHGIYCTVVEEILRDLYLANVGEAIWGMMKKETADTFENAGHEPIRGGWFFADQLAKLIAEGARPEITLVGHSAGSIYICNFLRYVENLRTSSNHPLPEDFKFKNVIFEAPACDFKLFSEVLEKCSHLIENFRMFTMKDEGESGKPLVPVLYTRSLLYFVSGVLEKEPNDSTKGAYDRPLVGMQRYYLDTNTYRSPEIVTVRNYVYQNPDRVVWATENRGPGLSSSADQHGGFAEEPDTLESVKQIIIG